MRRRWPVASLAVVVVLAVAIVDSLAPAEAGFSLFYVVPVMLVTASTGRRVGYATAAVAALASTVAATVAGAVSGTSSVTWWNVAVETLLFATVAHVLADAYGSRQRAEDLARTDPLTGLANLRAFKEAAERELARARRTGEPLTLVYADVNHFKLVNDRFGHSGGDEVLAVAGEALRRGSRTADVAARLGGDEFVVLLPSTGAGEARLAIERLGTALEAAEREAGWPVTFSLGGATFHQPPDSVDAMLAAADEQMYRVKRGRADSTIRRVS